LLALAMILGPFQGGCQSAAKPVFPQLEPAPVWPAAPDQPRIRYVGALSGERDLHRVPSGWEALRGVFTGPRPPIGFLTPTAVAVSDDLVFVCDRQLGGVHVLNLATRDYALWTSAGDERFGMPMDVTLCDGKLAVADARRKVVDLFTLGGEWLSRVGDGLLERPASLAWDASRRELWVLDSAAHACLVFDLSGELKRSIGGRGAGPLQFNYPAGLAYSPALGALVADSMNFRVQIIGENRSPVIFGDKGDAAGNFALPRDLAVDSAGHIYVLDSQFENVQVFDRAGRLLMAFGEEGSDPGEFSLPSGITIDASDRIWVADTYNRRVQVFQYLSEDASWAQE